MTWMHYLDRLRGSTVRFDLHRYGPLLADIAQLEAATQGLTDIDITERARALRQRARGGESLTALQAPLFALAREAARRVLGQRPFDEQIVAGLALHDGSIVEMQTGEGKTLAAVMPAALNACDDRGVHVLTFNDYLAQRDVEWMGPIYRLLGLSVAHIEQGMASTDRQRAYHADITYVTAKEAGFDHLRDLLAMKQTDLVHRPFHFALVDEADSILIDEATVPLVIAGRVDRDASRAPYLAVVARALRPGVDLTLDEYQRNVDLTDAGIARVEQALGCGSLHSPHNIGLLSELNCALHAQLLLRRDVDYIVRNARIEMVDEHTGRVVRDRHWPDGLQAAIEAKEGVERRADGRILGSVTLQRFLRGYAKLSGMTGTARDASRELHRIYGLEVVVIPTHRPVARVDHPDLLFTTREAKERAVIDDIRRAHATGRPGLVGTARVVESERLSARLRDTGIDCQVLNAKNDAEEALIVARAGEYGAVTISTNMAGRGTDIRLGGHDEVDHDRVARLGGLYVIGTNRHESHRVDLQLRGRAGRQGDPGESRFYVSLEDDLLVRFGLRELIGNRYKTHDTDQAIDNPVARREVARTQRIVEGQNFEIRSTLGRYSHVVEQQLALIHERRRAMLAGELELDVWQREPRLLDALVASAGEQAVRNAERLVTLACVDRAWRDHLAFCSDLREGVHLVRLGGGDPLTRFSSAAIQAFGQIDDAIDEAVLAALPTVRVIDGRVDLSSAGVEGPSATWTYLVNDDPFKNQLTSILTGPGGVTIAMYSAAVLGPLLVAWGIVERLMRRRRPRRTD